VAGRIPCHKLYESDKILAFLDINPLSLGHALIIPKQHAGKLTEVSDETLEEMLPLAKKIAKALNVAEFNVLQNNGRMAHQEIEHVHLHVIPKRSVSEGLGIRWDKINVSNEQLTSIASDIKSKLN
jgi:diadenosine tetraphosphate (Ap4A) HIT family hydrolase